MDYLSISLERISKASDKCKKNVGDVSALQEYEAAIDFALSHEINLSSSHRFRYVSACVKGNQNNMAWSYLNKMVVACPDELARIRLEQCRICKKEKRWPDALRFLMMGHVDKCSGFNRAAFLKDLKPIANKLLVDGESEYLARKLAAIHGEDYERDAEAANLFEAFYIERLTDR